ncbi:hypothetical protein AGMMS50262_22740 [Bacteroidia bacterium]|nr:hypothetical protein AGMMS50262_22740 [Bacteroidia bacterium]
MCYALSNNAADEIDLSGNLPANKTRSLFEPAIEAFIAGQSIEVGFHFGLGTINIIIYNETGSIDYQQSIGTYAGQNLIIDISSLNEGIYTIMFVNAQGQYLSGVFEI